MRVTSPYSILSRILLRRFAAAAMLAVTGCETIRGGSASFQSPSKPRDLSCLELAVKATPQLEFLKAENSTTQGKTIGNKPVDHFDHQVEFKLREVSLGSGAASWNESHSIDSSSSYNHSSLGAVFGYMNGRDYNPEEKKKIRSALDSLGMQIKTSCGQNTEFTIKIY